IENSLMILGKAVISKNIMRTDKKDADNVMVTIKFLCKGVKLLEVIPHAPLCESEYNCLVHFLSIGLYTFWESESFDHLIPFLYPLFTNLTKFVVFSLPIHSISPTHRMSVYRNFHVKFLILSLYKMNIIPLDHV